MAPSLDVPVVRNPAPPVADLARLIAPRSIAFIGGRDAAEAVRICRRFGFDGAIWPVSATRSEMEGIACLPDLDALPAAPDAAFVGVNRHAAVDVVARLTAMGAGGAVAYASGFAETADGHDAGTALQGALVSAAGAMPLLGPNCYGLLNATTGAAIWPSEHGAQRCERGVALISQSTNIALSMTMQRRALPLAFVGTVGNQAQTGLSTLACAALAMPQVTALGLYVEAIDSVTGFEALASEARAAAKPIVMLRAGRTGPAQAATLSHTASLAGSDAAAEAFFQRLGLARVPSITALIEALKLAHVHGALPGGRPVARLGARAASGGEAAMLADRAADLPVAFPELSPAHARAVATTLGDIVHVANPLDYHTFIWADRGRMAHTFAAFLGGRQDGGVAAFDLGLLTLDWVREDRCSARDWLPAIDAIEDAAAASGCPTAVLATLPENLPEPIAERLISKGIVPFAGIDDMLAAVAAASAIGLAWASPEGEALCAVPDLSGDGRLLDEAAAKAALSRHGIAIPAGAVVSPSEVSTLALALGGRVAVKALGLAHKTEVGGVALDLDADGAAGAAAEMAGRLGLSSVLVEAMAPRATVELIVGITRAPPYGLALTLGAGGVVAEVMADSATLLLPCDRAAIGDALDRLRIAPLLTGHRGRPGVDMNALLGAVEAIARYALAERERLLEVEVNPLMVGPWGAIAADALIRLEETP
ncbi:MAG: acetate--CoA ligase family protein [Pseudomonadota bacterium]